MRVRESLVATFLLAVLSPVVAAASPVALSHSGFLLDGSDAAVTGARTMTFAIYDPGGTLVWTSAACPVTVAAGYYAVVLGTTCNGTPALDSSHLPPGERRLLELTVGSTVLTPRQEISVLPSAEVAATSLDTQALITDLSTPGTLNAPGNPVDWTKLKNVPSTLNANALQHGGNTFGADAVVGTTDHFALALMTNGTPRLNITADGAVDVTGALSADRLKLAYSSASCDASSEGSLRYNPTSKKMEFCNGSVWGGVGGTVASITLGGPSVSVTKSGPVTFTVTYGSGTDTSSLTLGTGNVHLGGSGSAGCSLAVSGSGLVRTITVNGCVGTGTVNVSIDAGSAISTSGDPASAAGPSTAFQADNTGPSIPSGLTLGAVGVNFTVTPTISYGASTDVGGGTVANYQVQVTKTSDGSIVSAFANHVPGASVTGLALASATTYTVFVRAIDSFGNASNTASANFTTSLGRTFAVSPAISGKTTWNLDTDGIINLGTAGTWTFTPQATFTANVKLWGAGGGGGSYPSGAGGFASGSATFTNGVAFTVYVGAPGTTNTGGAPGGGNTSNMSGGGGYSGLRLVSGGTAILIAGGGGGGGWGGVGGAGGGATGQDGTIWDTANSQGLGGTQLLGGGNGGSGSTSGTAFQGGNGGPTGNSFAGGAGGGGYFGGGGGGYPNSGGSGGGGGGSSYFNPASVTSGVLTGGNRTTAGNDSDPQRGTAGNTNTAGRAIFGP